MRTISERGGPSQESLKVPEYGLPDPALVEETEKLLLFSYLIGMNHVTENISLADEGEEIRAVKFEEATSFMKSRVPLTKPEWKELETELRFRAFTVAALAKPDLIERVRKHTLDAVENGTPLSEYWTNLKAEGLAGLSGDSPGYWETVFRTNVQTSYNAGRAAQFSKEQPEYLEFVGIEDMRQTEICASRSGTILPASHPFWKSNWPPLHFNCRSTVRAVYKEEVDVMRELGEYRGVPEPASLPTIYPAKGFGGNPIETGSFFKLTPKMIKRAQQYEIIGEIRNFGESLGLTGLDLPKDSASKKPRNNKKTEQQSLEFKGISSRKMKSLALTNFAQAPDDLKQLAEKTHAQFSYAWGRGNSAYYNVRKAEIFIGAKCDEPDVFSHEYGHALDHKVGSWFSSSEDFRSAFLKDHDRIIDPKTERLLPLGEKLIEEIKQKEWESVPAVSDIFDSLTNKKITGRWGHSKRYWSIPGMRTKEVFADIISLHAQGNDETLRQVKEYIPSVYDEVEKFLGRK